MHIILFPPGIYLHPPLFPLHPLPSYEISPYYDQDGVEVATLYGHEFGIKCVQFSPDMQEIISVGMEHDNVVNVWAWPSGCKIAANNILGGQLISLLPSIIFHVVVFVVGGGGGGDGGGGGRCGCRGIGDYDGGGGVIGCGRGDVGAGICGCKDVDVGGSDDSGGSVNGCGCGNAVIPCGGDDGGGSCGCKDVGVGVGSVNGCGGGSV